MKLALIGYGKMGRIIETCALERGHTIVQRLTSEEWDPAVLREVDLCIEFTRPEAALQNIAKAASQQKPILIGTTGWESDLEAARKIALEANIGALYSPNFSLGVRLLLNILAHATKLIDHFDEYDRAGIECHHNRKKDPLSGTAMEIARTIDKASQKKTTPFPFSSVRCGSIPGSHTILFDSPCDTITISHSARNQTGFALGAVKAAEWLHGKKGWYTLDDCISDLTGAAI